MGDKKRLDILLLERGIADSREKAEEIAYGRYYEGTVEWQDCDIEVEARKIEKNRGER